MNKFCVGCRHMEAIFEPVYGEVAGRLCRSPWVVGRWTDDADRNVMHIDCWRERGDLAGCGPEGKFWEAKWV